MASCMASCMTCMARLTIGIVGFGAGQPCACSLAALHTYCCSLADARRACVIVGTAGVGASYPCAFSLTYTGIDYHECYSCGGTLAVGILRAAPRAIQRLVQRRSDSSDLAGCVTLRFRVFRRRSGLLNVQLGAPSPVLPPEARSWITCGHSPGPGPPAGLEVKKLYAQHNRRSE